jgi:hypothetical protein
VTSTDPQHRDSGPAFEWTRPGVHLRFDHGDGHPVHMADGRLVRDRDEVLTAPILPPAEP